MSVVYTVNYFLVGCDVLIDNDALLVTDFVNLKIKPAQSFEVAHRGIVYVHIFIYVNAYMWINICTVFLKNTALCISFLFWTHERPA
jgi:hypothetical protein